jgi:hypothetical protein
MTAFLLADLAELAAQNIIAMIVCIAADAHIETSSSGWLNFVFAENLGDSIAHLLLNNPVRPPWTCLIQACRAASRSRPASKGG